MLVFCKVCEVYAAVGDELHVFYDKPDNTGGASFKWNGRCAHSNPFDCKNTYNMLRHQVRSKPLFCWIGLCTIPLPCGMYVYSLKLFRDL